MFEEYSQALKMHNVEDVSAWSQSMIFLFVWGNKENVTRDILYQI